MRFTDQYFWNIVFMAFFLSIVTTGVLILEGDPEGALHDISLFEFVLLSLASFRLTRLVVYDKITAFFREQFYNAKTLKKSVILEKPISGPRRTLADLLSCPWCFGMWAGATVVFFYELSPYAYYPILMLAISGVGTMLQLAANLVGWKAEQLKGDTFTR